MMTYNLQSISSIFIDFPPQGSIALDDFKYHQELKMRDNYVGDVGDFFKYGLLRQLASSESGSALRLGVAWYLYADPCNPADGRHLQYLEEKKRNLYRPCDPELYDKLRELIAANARSVVEVRNRDILPSNTLFHEEPLSLAALPKGHASATGQRLAARSQWHQRMLDVTKDADIVFFDPDNGLEVSSVPKHHDKGPKFTFYDELVPFWQRGQSLVIYQHRTRQGLASKQIQDRVQALTKLLAAPIQTVFIPAGSGRFFFIVLQPMHSAKLIVGLENFRNNFAQHIQAVT